MTLPASGAISLSQIANEVGLSLPISINHAWLLKLINKSGLPVSFSDFYGKTGRFDTVQAPGSGGQTIQCSNAPLFGGNLNYIFSGGVGASGNILFNSAPTWTGNLKVVNNTTGATVVMVLLAGTGNQQWGGGPIPANFMRNGIADSFTITPSN